VKREMPGARDEITAWLEALGYQAGVG